MNNRQSYTLKAYRTVQNFVDANATTLGPIAQSPPRQTLDSVVLNLTGHAAAQGAALTQRVGATSHQSVLRRQLVANHMRPIAAVARDIVSGTPEASAFTVPPRTLNVERVVAAANAMAAAATPFAQTFISSGLPTDFLDQLRNVAAAVTGQVNVQGSSQTSRVQATAGLAAEVKRGRRALNILDSLIAPVLAGNPELLAGWESAKRITPRANAKAAPSAPETNPATPVTPTPVVVSAHVPTPVGAVVSQTTEVHTA